MQRRSFSVSSLLIFLTLVILSAGTYWAAHYYRPQNQPAITQAEEIPDHFAENVMTSIMKKSGKTLYRIDAQQVWHYEHRQQIVMTAPLLKIFPIDQSEVTVLANGAVADDAFSIVDLYGQAQITRAASQEEPLIQAFSEYFRAYPRTELLTSDLPVQLKYGQSWSTADSMTINYAERTLQLSGRVKGIHFPR